MTITITYQGTGGIRSASGTVRRSTLDEKQAHGYKLTAHWNDPDDGGPCSGPAERTSRGKYRVPLSTEGSEA